MRKFHGGISGPVHIYVTYVLHGYQGHNFRYIIYRLSTASSNGAHDSLSCESFNQLLDNISALVGLFAGSGINKLFNADPSLRRIEGNLRFHKKRRIQNYQ